METQPGRASLYTGVASVRFLQPDSVTSSRSVQHEAQSRFAQAGKVPTSEKTSSTLSLCSCGEHKSCASANVVQDEGSIRVDTWSYRMGCSSSFKCRQDSAYRRAHCASTQRVQLLLATVLVLGSVGSVSAGHTCAGHSMCMKQQTLVALVAAVAVLSMAVLVLISHILWLHRRVRRLKGKESVAKHREEDDVYSQAVKGLCMACDRISQLSILANGPGPNSYACPADSSYRTANNANWSASRDAEGAAMDWHQATPAATQDGSRGRNTRESATSCKETGCSDKGFGGALDSVSVSNGSMMSMSVPVRSGSSANEGNANIRAGNSGRLQGSRQHRICCTSGTCQFGNCTCGRYCTPSGRHNALPSSCHAQDSQSELAMHATRTTNTSDSDADSMVYRSLGLQAGCHGAQGTSSKKEVKKRVGDSSQHLGRQSPTVHSVGRAGSYSSELSDLDVDQPPHKLTNSPTLLKLSRVGGGVSADCSPTDGYTRADNHPWTVSISSAGSVSLALTQSAQTPAQTTAKRTVSTTAGGSPSSRAQPYTPDSSDQEVESAPEIVPSQVSSPELNKQFEAVGQQHGNDLEGDRSHNDAARGSWRWWPFAQSQKHSPAKAEAQNAGASNHVGVSAMPATSSAASPLPTLSPPMPPPPANTSLSVSPWRQHNSIDAHTVHSQLHMHAEHAEQAHAGRSLNGDSGKFLRSSSFPSVKAVPEVLDPSKRSSLDGSGLGSSAISAVHAVHVPSCIDTRVAHSIANGMIRRSRRSFQADAGARLGLPRPSSLTEVASAARTIMQMSETGCSRRRSTTALPASSRYHTPPSANTLARASAPQVLLSMHEQYAHATHSRSHSHSSQSAVHAQSAQAVPAVPSSANAHLSELMSSLGGLSMGTAHLMSPSMPHDTKMMTAASSATNSHLPVVVNLPHSQTAWAPNNGVQMHTHYASPNADMTLKPAPISPHADMPQFQLHQPGPAEPQHPQHAGGSPLTSSMLAAFGVGASSGHSALGAHSSRSPSALGAPANGVHGTHTVYGSVYQMSNSPPSSLLSVASSDAQVAKEKVSHAVSELRGALAAELKHNDVQFNRIIGRGGFGTVYHGLWRGLEVAIKTIIFSCSPSAEEADGIAQEAAIATNLCHRNVVATYSHDVLDVARTAGAELGICKFYLIQEFCRGGALRTLLQQGALSAKQLPHRFKPILGLVKGIARGMEYITQRGICHGDLNPANILLQYDPKGHASVEDALSEGAAVVKITDFGLSMRMAGNKSHASGIQQGTPFYTAPEVTAQQQLHRESDVYSFGVIMWELLSGTLASYPECPSRPVIFDTISGDLANSTNSMSSPSINTTINASSVRPVRSKSSSAFTYHREFPNIPDKSPLTYLKTMNACLSKDPAARPSFSDILILMEDLEREVSSGEFLNTVGCYQDPAVLNSVSTDAHEASWPLPTASFSATDTPLSRALQHRTIQQALQDRADAITAANATLHAERGQSQNHDHLDASMDLSFVGMPDSAGTPSAADGDRTLQHMSSGGALSQVRQPASLLSHGQCTTASDETVRSLFLPPFPTQGAMSLLCSADLVSPQHAQHTLDHDENLGASRLMHGKGPGNSPRAVEATNPTLAVATASHSYVERSRPQVSTFGERRSHDSQSSAATPSASTNTESMLLTDAVPGRLPSGRGKRLSASTYTAPDAVPDASVGGATVTKVLGSCTSPQVAAFRDEEWLWGPGDSPTAADKEVDDHVMSSGRCLDGGSDFEALCEMWEILKGMNEGERV